MNLKEYIKSTGFETPEPKGLGIAIIDSGFNVDNGNVEFRFNAFTKTKDVTDIYGHGTAVYEIINSISPNSKFYLFKALDDYGKGNMLSIYEALIRCRDIEGVDIVCMSFSSFQKLSDTTQKALEECLHEKKIIISSLGNDGANKPTFPSSIDGVFKVGSLSADDIHKREEGTNFSNTTHFVALGENIMANGRLRSGTSFATAVVVGQIAELLTSENISPKDFDYKKAKKFLAYETRFLDNALGSIIKPHDEEEDYKPTSSYVDIENAKELENMEFTDSDYQFTLERYKGGYSKESIEDYLTSFGLTFSEFIEILLQKEIQKNNKKGKRLSENAKEIIATRDANGVSRTDITNELHLNYVTVKRACERYGFGNKKMERTHDLDLYEKLSEPVQKVSNGIICLKCKKRANSVEESVNTFYCPDCLEEYTVRVENHLDTLYRTRWENVD